VCYLSTEINYIKELDDMTQEIRNLKNDLEIISQMGKDRVVQYDLRTGKWIEVFFSAKEAAKAVGLKTPAGIYNTISGRQGSSMGYGWKRFK
jgi:hypothetical protein